MKFTLLTSFQEVRGCPNGCKVMANFLHFQGLLCITWTISEGLNGYRAVQCRILGRNRHWVAENGLNWWRKALFYLDNPCASTSPLTRTMLFAVGSEMLPHLLYSRYLALFDFFSKLKKLLADQKFESNEAILDTTASLQNLRERNVRLLKLKHLSINWIELGAD